MLFRSLRKEFGVPSNCLRSLCALVREVVEQLRQVREELPTPTLTRGGKPWRPESVPAPVDMQAQVFRRFVPFDSGEDAFRDE